MKRVKTENVEYTVPDRTGERPPFASHLTNAQYYKFLRVNLKHATSYPTLEERSEFELSKVTKVMAWDNGIMIINYTNGKSFKFPPAYA